MNVNWSKLKHWILGTLTLTLIAFISFTDPVFAAEFSFPQVTPEPKPLQILGPAGERFRFVKTGKTTCGKYVIAEAIIPPGTGPMPHVHIRTNEWFYTPDGGITLEMGEHQYKNVKEIPGKNVPKDTLRLKATQPGDIHYGPQYIIHGFMNQTNEPKRLTFVWTPDAGVTDYFKAVGQPLPDYDNPPPINPKNKELFINQAPKYGINQSRSYYQYIENVIPTNYAFSESELDSHFKELVTLLTDKSCSANRR
jgi:mannose-6-phosphate isomerase-like protein (cupin superfamily)